MKPSLSMISPASSPVLSVRVVETAPAIHGRAKRRTLRLGLLACAAIGAGELACFVRLYPSLTPPPQMAAPMPALTIHPWMAGLGRR